MDTFKSRDGAIDVERRMVDMAVFDDNSVLMS